VRMNYRVHLSSVRGFREVNLDIVALDKDNKPILAVYVGRRKERKVMKYKLTKVHYLELADEESLGSFISLFIEKYAELLY